MSLGRKTNPVSDLDREWMRYALRVGRRGQGQAWPNPAVGCVLVRDGRVIALGHTAQGGRPHAERAALDMAGPLAKGTTAYVTLEPCAHHGQTPPCAQGLINAGITRVVIATQDPDSRVNGQGVQMLQTAGIEVVTGTLEDEARRDLSGFFQKITMGRPSVTLKLATSLDGRIATASGESQWITGAQARKEVHHLRLCHDAVMVGAGTARADDPQLTVRGMGNIPQPVRVVLSRKLDLPFPSALAQSMDQAALWLMHGREAGDEMRAQWQEVGAKCIECAAPNGRLDVLGVLKQLGNEGLTSVFCEGGGTLAASLLGEDLVDDLIVYHGPITLGAEGWPAVGALGLETLAEAPRFALVDHKAIGADTVSYWRRQRQSRVP